MVYLVQKHVKHKYIEAFLQLGQNIPCKSEGHDTLVNICTNITQGNWCPQSSNGHLRALLENKQTWYEMLILHYKLHQFCHICDSISEESKEANTLRKYIFNEGMERCDTEQDQQTLYFKICTPSRHEINEQQGENREKLEEYWSYLKQGVMTTVVHVMDRVELSESKRAQCQQMCGTYENKRGVSHSYRNTLLKSIETMCRPVDNYAACMYHTVKFDMDGDFY
uniref:T5orf172 domain-containing protein n=1 Tax=Heterorhabditis bacteriophora TaxID=37862 RepID=A0A1I7X7K2_HETBA